MKTKLKQSVLMLFLVVGLFSVGTGRAEALSSSQSWNGGLTGTFNYWWDGFGFGPVGGWTSGLANPNVTVTYNAQVKKNGLPLVGNVVSVGDTITFEAIPYQDTDISWFGTGYSLDSPYGRWITNADAPDPVLGFEWQFVTQIVMSPFTNINTNRKINTCRAGDYVTTVYPSGVTLDVYIPFSVNYPSSITYDHTGSTAGLSCDGSGQNCTVTSPGSIVGYVNFGSTYGKFYYRYYDYRSGPRIHGMSIFTLDANCFGNNISMATINIDTTTVPFNLTAVSNNNNPTVPTVTPQPFNGNTSTAYPFSFTATDPDAGDRIAYEVDWNNDGVTDQSTGFVTPGVTQSLSNPIAQWPIAGTYSFKVRTKDNKGGVSAWATPSATVASIVNGVCGLASGFSFDTLTILSPALCMTGTPGSFLSTGTGWTWGCNGSGGGTSTASNACTATIKTYTLTAVKNLGLGSAGTIVDVAPTATSIDSTVPRNSEAVLYNASRTLRANPNSSSVSWSGCTSVSGNDCTITNITSAKTVTATFTRLAEPGVCGSANGQSFETLTTASSGICTSGAITGFSLSGTAYSWGCNGSFGSAVNVSCSATQLRNYNWTEGTP